MFRIKCHKILASLISKNKLHTTLWLSHCVRLLHEKHGVFLWTSIYCHDCLHTTQVKACFITIKDRFWIKKTTEYKFMKTPVSRLEVQEQTQLPFFIVTTFNSFIVHWPPLLDILHWKPKRCNDFSGLPLTMLQYHHIFLCGQYIFSHFSFCTILTLLPRTSLWFCMVMLWKALHLCKILCDNVLNISFRTSSTTLYKHSLLNAMFHTISQYSIIWKHV